MAVGAVTIYLLNARQLHSSLADTLPNKKLVASSPLGNVLATYFYYIAAKPDPELLAIHTQMVNHMVTSELQTFYQSLDWSTKVPLIEYDSSPRSAWHELDAKGNPKANYLLYWSSLRSFMQQIYVANLPPIDIQHPVVHFRCSDSPFNKHNEYHIPKASSVTWMAQQIKKRGYNKITMLSCNSHRSLDQNSCQKYSEYYAQIFSDAGIEVQTQCNSILFDFALMVHSPVLVALNASSFSFMAGVAKDPNNFISCNMGKEIKGKYYLQTNADWVLDPAEPLLHSQVKDYNNTKDVIAKLHDIR